MTMGVMQLNIDLKTFTEDQLFKSLSREFDDLINSKGPKAAKASLERIANITKFMFGKTVILSVIENPMFFYGFCVYPSKALTKRLVDCFIDGRNESEDERKTIITSNWMNSERWYVEIDKKCISDIGNLFNGKDLAILYVYSLIRVIYNPDLPKLAWYKIFTNVASMGKRNQMLATSPSARYLLTIPIYTAVAHPAFAFKNDRVFDLFGQFSPSANLYKSTIAKVINRYGMIDGIIDVSNETFNNNLQYSINWIMEAIGDLKYSANRLIHNIEKAIASSRSPYMRLIYRDLILEFNKVQGKYLGIQNALESSKPNPDQIAVMERMTEEYWKGRVVALESHEFAESIDNHGFIKKVNQRDIDLVRIELDSCTSTEDKIYLMERLYKHIQNIEAGLAYLADPKLASKVKQSKNELLRLKALAEETRQAILKFRIGPERYGLYIKYPNGYEG